MSLTVAELAVQSLIENGIDTLYCVPGVQNDPFFDALYDHAQKLTPIQARHEQGAAYMALGAALATGRPQAFSLVPGPGFLNGCAALCTAYSLNAPLLALIGQIPSRAIGKQFGLLHEIDDQLEILQSMTKFAVRVIDAGEAASIFADAWTALRTGRPRPVGVEVPVDIWRGASTAAAGSLAINPPAPEPVPAKAISAAAAMITTAKRPLIVVGSGAQDHSAEIRKMAAEIGAGVMTFRTGHGVMDSTDPQCITMPVGHSLWPECDLVIGLGTRLTTQKIEWGVDDNLQILHIDIDPEIPDRGPPATLKIIADLKMALPALFAAIAGGQPDRSGWCQTISETKLRFADLFAEKLGPQLGFLAAIRNALPEDGIFVDELTQIGYVSRFAFPSYHPRTFLSTGYQGTLGWGLATAMGAAHARRDVPVVSIAGDGGAMFTIAELASAALHNIPVNIIVMNDNAFGNVRGIQRDKFNERYIASNLTSPDFVQLAQSCGVTAAKATTPAELEAELRKAIQHDGPNLIEVPVGEFPSPWEFILMPKLRGV